MKKLILGVIATVFFASHVNAQTAREKFLEGKKSHKEVVDAYNNLSDAQQKELWLEKFNQLAELDLPNKHSELIKKLRDDFADGVDAEKEDFFITASELARITPAKDFGYMFETLEDYKYEGKFIDTKLLSDEFVNDVKNLNAFINLKDSIAARGNCSCRWCLGMGTTGTNCKPTEHGCGFLWMQSCNQCVLCL
jgi:hypothetical protein